MNVDRIISIIGIITAIMGILIGIYLSKPEISQVLLALSGWIAALIILVTLSVTSSIIIAKLERDLIKSKNDQIEMKEDLVQYKNISQALATTVTKPPKRRKKLN